jgi:Uma2 family endonuclease
MPAMKAVAPRVSFAELQQWPDDERRYELYDGEVIVVPAPLPRHQRVALHIAQLLGEYELTSGGLLFHSPVDIVLSEYDSIQPDVVFFTAQRRPSIDMMRPIRVPPDLAVEVLSRSTEVLDRGRKMELLARFGVPEYWIVDPVRHTLEIYAAAAGTFALAGTYDASAHAQSPTLPALTIDTARMFAE